MIGPFLRLQGVTCRDGAHGEELLAFKIIIDVKLIGKRIQVPRAGLQVDVADKRGRS